MVVVTGQTNADELPALIEVGFSCQILPDLILPRLDHILATKLQCIIGVTVIRLSAKLHWEQHSRQKDISYLEISEH